MDVSGKQSIIQQELADLGIDRNIFLFVDTSKAKLKKDLTYAYGDTCFFWVDSRAQKYDAAGRTNPDSDIGKKMCGWTDPSNVNFRYCWENVQPGLTTGYLFNSYKIPPQVPGYPQYPQECVFSKYDIQLLATTTDPNNPDLLEGKLVLTHGDERNQKYIYSDKTLANKSGTNVNLYAKAAASLTDFIAALTSPGTQMDKWRNSSLVISKYCGDTLQALMTAISMTIGIRVKYTNYSQQGNTIEEIPTNQNSIFVTYDRIAAAFAIHFLGIPVILDRGDTCDIFVPKSFQDPCRQFMSAFPNENFYQDLLTKYNGLIQGYANKYVTVTNYFEILKQHITKLANINININNGNATDADETYRYVIALWKHALHATQLYGTFEETYDTDDISYNIIGELQEKIRNINDLCRDSTATEELKKTRVTDVTLWINENVGYLNSRINSVSSTIKAVDDLINIINYVNTDLGQFLNVNNNVGRKLLLNKRVWDLKIKSDILYKANPFSHAQRGRSLTSRIMTSLFNNADQNCSIFAMGDIMTICDFLKSPFGESKITTTDSSNISIKRAFITQIDAFIHNLTTNQAINTNFNDIIDKFRNKLVDIIGIPIRQFGGMYQEQQDPEDNINELTRIIKMELLIKTICCLRDSSKNIIFNVEDDNFFNVEDEDKTHLYDDTEFRQDTADEPDDINQVYLINKEIARQLSIKNVFDGISRIYQDTPLSPRSSRSEYHKDPILVQRVKIRETTKRTLTDEERPKDYDDVDDSYDDSKETIIYKLTDNGEVYIVELSKYSPEIITFNDAEAIIDMDSENPTFDRLFRSVINQIYMACESSNTNIRIDVNREFLDLFIRVLNGLGLGLDVNAILSGAQVAPQSPVASGQGVAEQHTPEQAIQGSVPSSAATTQAADTPYSTQAPTQAQSQSQSQAQITPGAAAAITAAARATSGDIGEEEGKSDEESQSPTGGKPRKPKHTKRRKYKKQQRNTRRGKQNKRKRQTRKVKNIKKSNTYKHK
jgi:hypothetical protein